MLTQDHLAERRRVVDVQIPEEILADQPTIHVRSLFEAEQSRFESTCIDRNGKPKKDSIESSRRRYIALCVVDDDGNPYLKSDDLRKADSRLVNFVYRCCCQHNGLNDDEAEELLGNLKATPA